MCWVALDRAIRIARHRGLPADLVRWTRVRDEIYRRIMERGWTAERQARSSSTRTATCSTRRC